MRAASFNNARPICIDPTPELVRVESITVGLDAQLISAEKITEEVLSRQHMIWLHPYISRL